MSAGNISNGDTSNHGANSAGQPLVAAQQRLAASPRLRVQQEETRLVVTRRGPAVLRQRPFRILVPQVWAVVTAADGRLRWMVRPDSLAIFMVVMLVGGVAVEVLMDRATYPRDYPPAFIYGLAAAYVGWLGAEWRATYRQLRALLAEV